MNRTGITDVIKLFSQLAARRMRYPCRQCRSIRFSIAVPQDETIAAYPCIVDDIHLDTGACFCSSQAEEWKWFR